MLDTSKRTGSHQGREENPEALTDDALRVLKALCRVSGQQSQKVVPLRRIANWALGGEMQQAAVILARLDLAGYVRTNTMGWHAGWITERGLRAAADAEPGGPSS